MARPADISPAEAALRPDVLVVESGEVIIPGVESFGYDIGLPPKVAYACLAEAALLAMEGRFEDYTLGRNIEMERVKEVYHMFKKHGFQIAGLTAFGKYVSEEEYAHKRALAEGLRNDAVQFARLQADTAAKLAQLPLASKGVSSKGHDGGNALKQIWPWVAAAGAGVAGAALLLNRRRRE